MPKWAIILSGCLLVELMLVLGKPIQLSLEEKEQLLTMSRSQKLEKGYVDRAKIILLSDQGLLMNQIVAQTRLSRPVVNK